MPVKLRAAVRGFIFLLAFSLPLFGVRKADTGSSENGSTTPVPNCPDPNATPNFAILDGSSSCSGLAVPLNNQVITLTDTANTFRVTITPAIWDNGFSSGNTIMNVNFTNLSSSKPLSLVSLVVGTVLNDSNYVLCQAGELENVNGTAYCNQGQLTLANGSTEVLQPTPITAANLTNTRWDFDGITAALGATSTMVSLVGNCIPATFVPDYQGDFSSVCDNNLSTPISFLAQATDGTTVYSAGTLQIPAAPAAANDTSSTATAIASNEFTDFIDTTATEPQEILTGSGAGGETVNQGDPSPTCALYQGRVFRSVWYTFTPPINSTVRVSTDGSSYDTIVSVYTGAPPNLTQIACNDDGNSQIQSSDLTFTSSATAGTLYYIMVSEAPPDVGTILQNNVTVPAAVPLSNNATLNFSLSVIEPTPFVDSVLPPTAWPGTVIPTITLAGAGFAPGALVNFNGVSLTPTSISPNKIILSNVAVPANSTTFPVKVINPYESPSVGISNALLFLVTGSASVGFTNAATALEGAVFAPVVADLNGDGKLDVVFASAPYEGPVILLGNGDGTFQAPQSYPATEDNNSVALADFNGDGKLDLVVTNSQNGILWLLLGNGDGTFQSATSDFIGDAPFFATAGDFNSDGKMDLAVLESDTQMVWILLGNGDGTFQSPVQYPAGGALQFAIPGDFNGDGILDLAVLNDGGSGGTNSVSILLGADKGTFQAPQPTPTGVSPVYEVAADFNGDGKLDLAVANQTDGSISVLLGNGNGTFNRTDYSVGGGDVFVNGVVTGDVNGDGKLDLLASTANGLLLLLGNGDGTFQTAIPFSEPNNPFEAVLGDFNNDGRLDAIAADDFGYDVFLQQTPLISFSTKTLPLGNQAVGTLGSPKSVTITNSGTAVLTLAIAGSGDFGQTNNCGGSLQPGSNCQVTISFSPTWLGTAYGAISVTDNAPGSPQLVELSGTGTLPFTVSPSTLAFGSVTVGGKSAAKTVTLTNNEATTTAFTFSASGNYSAVGSGTSPCGSSLASKKSCTISVTFEPTTKGAIDGDVSITDKTEIKVQSVMLSGTGTGGSTPPLTFSPATLTFAEQAFGTSSPSQTVTIKNSSTKSLTIDSIAASGNFNWVGGSTKPCAAATQLAAGASCTIKVKFTAFYVGTLTGSVTVTDNAAVSQQVLELSGSGVLPVTASPSHLTFSAQSVGTVSAPQTVTLSNNTNTTLENLAIEASADFSVTTNGCASTLPANSQCSFSVSFQPSQVGAVTGSLAVTDSAVTSPQVMNLSGTGQ
jgi:hypothetical protein